MSKENVFNKYNHYWGNSDSITYGYTMRRSGLSAYPENSFNMALYIGDDPEHVHRHQEMLADELDFPVEKWVLPIQKHGGNIEEVTVKDRGTNISSLTDKLDDVDSLFTYDQGVLLTMNYADCIPVYVYSTADNFIGLAHAGWKGTAENITQKLISCYSGQKKDLKVIIGIGINQSHYEVDDKVINALQPLTEKATVKTDTGWMLDLKEVNKQQAITAGISEEQIYVTELGTEEDDFFSFRLEHGNTGRALAFIGRRDER